MACAVAVIVTHRQRVLFGKRPTKSTGFEWQLPGGWIEPGEAPAQAAHREVREETGLRLSTPHLVGLTSNRFDARNHSVSLYFEAACLHPDALELAEPERSRGWEWKRWDEVERDLFLPLRLLKNTNYQPFSQDRRRTYVSI